MERLSLIVGGSSPRPGVRQVQLVYADGTGLAVGAQGLSLKEIKLYIAEYARQESPFTPGRGLEGQGHHYSGNALAKTTLVAELVRGGATLLR